LIWLNVLEIHSNQLDVDYFDNWTVNYNDFQFDLNCIDFYDSTLRTNLIYNSLI